MNTTNISIKRAILRQKGYIVFVPCNQNQRADLSRVPARYRGMLQNEEFEDYTIKTSKDQEILDEVSSKGYSLQEVVGDFLEGGMLK